MQPNPMAETSKLLFPSLRFFITELPHTDGLCDVVFEGLNQFRRNTMIEHHPRCFSRDRAQACAFLRKNVAFLQGAAELCGRHPNDMPEDSSKMAWACVSDFERYLDEAARGFADQLLCAGDPFSLHKLQRRHPRCLFEHTGKVEGAQLHQVGQRLDRNVLSETFAHIVIHLSKLPNRQTAAEV